MLRLAQLNLVENETDDLLGLVDNVKISEFCPDFEYCDDNSKLEYAVDYGDHEALDELSAEFICSDIENIAMVLQSDAFSFIREELVNHWMQDLTDDGGYQRLLEYAREYEDEETLQQVQDYVGDAFAPQPPQ